MDPTKEIIMGDMPGYTAKGPVLHYLDRLSREPDAKARLKVLLDELRTLLPGTHSPNAYGTANLAETLKTHLFDPFGDYSLTQRATDHLANDWFGRKGIADAMWHEHQPMEPIFCQGLITTIEAAIYQGGAQEKGERPQSFPINSLWVCAGNHYEMVVSQNLDQVTLLILTPGPDKRGLGLKPPPTAPGHEPHSLMVVKRRFYMEDQTIGGQADGGTIEQV
jgi:hypothetical protein